MTAMIFDMDSVLPDTESLHAEVKCEIVRSYFKVSIGASETSRRFAGMTEEVMFTKLVQELKLPFDELTIRNAVDRKWSVLSNLV